MALPGNMKRRVTLVKPAPKTANTFGEMAPQGTPTRFPVWASWKESVGREVLAEGQEFGTLPVIVEVWNHEQLRGLDETWSLLSEAGDAFDIVGVAELGGRNWQLRISAVRRK